MAAFQDAIFHVLTGKKKTKNQPYHQPTTYTFGNKKMRRRVKAMYFCLLIWLLEELQCSY